MNPRLITLWGVIVVLGGLAGATAKADSPERISFNFHIRPILSDRCYNCHGPDEENRQGGFRLDLAENAWGEADSGLPPIVPGDAEASEVMARLTSDDPSMRMPPEETKLTVTPEEIELVRQWIDQGAQFEEHWSYLPLRDPVVPAEVESAVARNEIDAFVLKRLKEKGLRIAAPATREQLIRRVTLDLTGLPPTLAEVDEFVADDSPDAYERLVDRLLASSRFGERMAVDWLDVARYSDTYGYQADKYRAMWSWRDWVVKAINDNLPYDQFITWQLAGDLLPDATDEQILATAFNRLHRQTNEGGSIEEEFRVEYVVDRVDTFGTAFLGLTVQCARCHDHKFDPITQKDYYQLFAYFDNIDESGLYSHYTSAVPTPTLLQITPEQEATVAELDQQIAEKQRWLEQLRASERSKFEQLVEGKRLSLESTGLIGDFPIDNVDDNHLANRADSERPAKIDGDAQLGEGRYGKGLLLSGENGFATKAGGDFTRDDPFTISLWINTPDVKERAVVWHRSQAWTDAGSRGYELLIENGKLNAALIHFWPGNAISIRTKRELPTAEWQQVTVTYDGSSRAAGIQIFINGQLEPVDVVRDSLTKTINYIKRARAHNEGDLVEVDKLSIGQRFRDRGFQGGLVDELKVFDRELTPWEVAVLFDDAELATRTTQTSDQLYEFYLHNENSEFRRALAELRALRAEKSTFLDEIPEIMVMREMPEPRQTYLLARGTYDAPAEPVDPATPSGLPRLRDDLPPNRLGLAQWLTDPAHPLTARVAVNRFWQMLLGTGLVSTPNDFGSQGQLPTHPELLDYLARSFIASGWDVKRLIKQIVMSATYRQSSECAPELLNADPDNAWLARGPRYRLPAEMIRDAALFTSGILVEEMGGPPVKPYQPPGLWEEKGSETYQRDVGAGSHRRSLYTFWKRTSPPPAMMTLDAADREVCVVERQTTATPLQALVLLNDPQFVEAARAAAVRTLQHEATTEGRVERLFREFTGRTPNAAEFRVLLQLFADQRVMFQSSKPSAEEFLAVGDHQLADHLDVAEVAALTVVAQAAMNHYDSVTKQ